MWLDYAVLWEGFTDIHALACNAAAWGKLEQSSECFILPTQISAGDVGFLQEMNTKVWAKIATDMKNIGLLVL